jgi:hypothetical protein
LEERFVVVRLDDKTFSVARYVKDKLQDTCTVLHHEDDTWTSDDIGFVIHRNEKANKRIRLVKRYLETNCRVFSIGR